MSNPTPIPPEVVEALEAGRKLRFVDATTVKVGDIRGVGGTITAVRQTAKTVFITNAMGTERLAIGTRIAIF